MNGRVDLRGVATFVAVACALSWAPVAPLWTSGRGLEHSAAGLALPLMMLGPALAAVLTVLWLRPEAKPVRGLGLLPRTTERPWLPVYAAAWFGPPLLALASPFVAAALGLYALDLQEFSAFRARLQAAGAWEQVESIGLRTVVGLQLAAIPLAPLLNLPFALGEELGWRGYLLPRLLPLGVWPALIVSGVIWGLWHAPVILLGYNYPQHPVLGVGLMTVLCVLLGVLLGWTRLATGSVWPAALAHGGLNGAAGVILLFAREGTPIDAAVVGITGWTGWLLLLAAIGLLVALRELPRPGGGWAR